MRPSCNYGSINTQVVFGFCHELKDDIQGKWRSCLTHFVYYMKKMVKYTKLLLMSPSAFSFLFKM